MHQVLRRGEADTHLNRAPKPCSEGGGDSGSSRNGSTRTWKALNGDSSVICT
jgi:hypothetical protein